MKTIKFITLGLSALMLISCNAAENNEHVHDFGYLHEARDSTFLREGNIAYYLCEECGQYFDANKNEIETPFLPKLDKHISLVINNEVKSEIPLVEDRDNALIWETTNIDLREDDLIGLCLTSDNTYQVSFRAEGNIKEEYHVHNDAIADINVVCTDNGVHMSISGYEYRGLAVKVNDNLYPLNETTYYDKTTKTYIYGWHYFDKGDKVTVVNTITKETFDFDDIAESEAWKKHDYHRGENNEIVIDETTRYGVEFSRGGNNKITLTKTYNPNSGSNFAINYASDKENVILKDESIPKTSEEYKESTWYINNPLVINGSDYANYFDVKGLHFYQATLDISENEEFNIVDSSNNVVPGYHLENAYVDGDFYEIDNDYLKITKGGKYLVSYIPIQDIITISELGVEADAYMMHNGEFIPLTKDAAGMVHVNNLVITEKNDYVTFVDDKYGSMEITLADGTDATVVRAFTTSGMTLVYIQKTGTFNLHLNLSTKVLTVDIVSLDEEPTEVEIKYLYGKEVGTKTLTVNPDNADEKCVLGINITDISGYIVFYDTDYNMVDDVSLDTASQSIASTMYGLIYIHEAGTYDIFININTHVVRIVK